MSVPVADHESSELRRFLLISLSAHGILLVLAISFQTFSGPSLVLEKAPPVMRVDIVIPKVMPLKELPSEAIKPDIALEIPTPPTPAAIAPTIEPKSVNLDKVSTSRAKKQKDALSKLKTQMAMDKLKQLDSPKPQATQPVAGESISKGESLRGLTKLEYENYVEKLRQQIEQQWQLPGYLSQKFLASQVRIWIASNGNLIRYEVLKVSGNPQFDQIVEGTVKIASPYIPPPSQLVSTLETIGVDVELQSKR